MSGEWEKWQIGESYGYQIHCGPLVHGEISKIGGVWEVRVNRLVVGPNYADPEKAKLFMEWHICNGARLLGEAYRVIRKRNPNPSSV